MARSFSLIKHWKAICIVVSLLLFTSNSDAQNISRLSVYKPPQASTGYGDVWAEGNIACMGVWTAYSTYGMGIFDISNPASPVLLTVYNYGSSTQNRFEQGVIRDKICYVGCWASGTSWSGSGLHILSLTNPAAPVLLSRITRATAGTVINGFDDVHTLFLERNFLYEAAHNINTVNVKVFDITNPFAPVYVRDIVTTNTTKVHQITVGMKGTNTILYTSGWGGADNSNPNSYGQTDIWDVSNVGTQPARWLGRIYSGYNSHSSWPTPDGNTLIISRETPGGEVRFYDISTLPNPTASSTTNPAPFLTISPASMGLEADIPHNPVVVGNLLYQSWYQNGLQIFDISDRTKPVRIGSYDTYPSTPTSSYQGNWGIYPQLGLNKLLLSDINNGFFILDASAVLTATNNYPPLLVKSPNSATVSQGSSTTLTPVITGSSLKYQWRLNGSNLNGQTNATLSFNNIQTNSSGNYMVIATNSFGAVTSAVASVSVSVTNFPPTISAPPQNVSVYVGQTAIFSVAVTGDAPFFYQWRLNGSAIANATNGMFTVESVQGEDVGNYSVAVSNSAGATISSNAALVIIDSPYLSNVHSTAGTRAAIISWDTTIASDSMVQFDLAGAGNQSQLAAASAAASFGNTSYTDSMISTNHEIILTGLTPATTYNFQVISTAGTNSYISGVYQLTTAGGAIILDNTNSAVTFSGTWSSSVNVSGFYGTNYRFANVSSSTLRTATFTPNLPVAGKYDVYEWHTAGTDRATNAPFTINYGGVSTTIRVNEQINNGKWNLLAAGLPFAGGTDGFVQLANNAGNTVVIADAVQFVYSDSQDFPAANDVPTWWSDYYFNGAVNPSLDPDNDGFTTAEEYVLGTSPISAAKNLTMKILRSGSNGNIVFSPLLGNRVYSLFRSTNLSSGNWQPVSTGIIYPDSTGQGTFSLSLTNTESSFYRISVQLTTNSPAFSGSTPTPQSLSFSPYATEAICGPNRAYVISK